MKPYKLTFAATAALLVSTAMSRANVSTATANYTALTDWGDPGNSETYSPSHSIVVQGFDTAFGTLNSVTIQVTSTVSGTLTVTNTGSVIESASAYLLDVQLDKLPDGTLMSPPNIISNAVTTTSIGPGASVSGAVSGSTTETKVYTTNLSQFDTSWTLMAGDYGSVFLTANPAFGKASYTDNSGVSVTAIYSYTGPIQVANGVPEPATLAVLGSGLAGLGLLRRRRR